MENMKSKFLLVRGKIYRQKVCDLREEKADIKSSPPISDADKCIIPSQANAMQSMSTPGIILPRCFQIDPSALPDAILEDRVRHH